MTLGIQGGPPALSSNRRQLRLSEVRRGTGANCAVPHVEGEAGSGEVVGAPVQTTNARPVIRARRLRRSIGLRWSDSILAGLARRFTNRFSSITHHDLRQRALSRLMSCHIRLICVSFYYADWAPAGAVTDWF